ncbi:hypothetical protein TB2_028257 [Malus domestica]
MSYWTSRYTLTTMAEKEEGEAREHPKCPILIEAAMVTFFVRLVGCGGFEFRNTKRVAEGERMTWVGS